MIPDTIRIHTVVSSFFFTNTYLVVNENNSEAFIIDPGYGSWKKLQTHLTNDIVIKGIIITHGHLDHIFDVSLIRSVSNAPVNMHKQDLLLLDQFVDDSRKYKFEVLPVGPPDHFCYDGQRILLGNVEFEFIHVPGHTPGSICLKWQHGIFTGDTLMYRKVGDCSSGFMNGYMESIKNVLFSLPGSLTVYPGHYRLTSIAEEIAHNTGVI